MGTYRTIPDAWIIAGRQWGEPQPLSVVVGTKEDALAKAEKMRAPNATVEIVVMGPYDLTDCRRYPRP